MRGTVPPSEMNQILSDLPDCVELKERMPIHWSYRPLNSGGQHPAEALREFWDGWHLLNEARFALVEAQASGLWYGTFRDPPDELAAAYFRRYYLDDASLRVYASHIHLLNAVKLHLGLRSKKRVRGSPLKKVLAGLHISASPSPVLACLLSFDSNPEWKQCEDYRNKWVHNERPNVKGLGPARLSMHAYTRTDEYEMRTGGGGEPVGQLSLEDLRRAVRGAYCNLFGIFEKLADFMASEIKSGLPEWGPRDGEVGGITNAGAAYMVP